MISDLLSNPQTLGEILGSALTGQCTVEDEFYEALAHPIAVHYRLNRDEVLTEIYSLELDYFSDTGLDCFGGELNTPVGVSGLGMLVAQKLLGSELAETLPAMRLSIH